VSEEYFVGTYPAAGGMERTSARWQTKLTRGFKLVGFTIDIARPTAPTSMNASLEDDTTLVLGGGKADRRSASRLSVATGLLPPTLAPIQLMLSASPKIGRRQRVPVFDPTTRRVLNPELTIRAESLFTVVDSAAPDQSGKWVMAHRDTVRAWRLDGAPNGLTAWVDAEGRVVAATGGGFSLTRTAFEIAFKTSYGK
jgi:hypothetical protein